MGLEVVEKLKILCPHQGPKPCVWSIWVMNVVTIIGIVSAFMIITSKLSVKNDGKL
jgi:hypothetical protein